MLRTLTIEDMQNLAEKREGMCLSDNYINSKTKLKWQCKYGHIWDTKPHQIKIKGSWCPYCAGKHKTIDDMHRMAAIKGGKCLSRKYIRHDVKLKWQCKEGHIWEAIPNSIKFGSWCSICKFQDKRLGLEEMQKIADKRGGKCLSRKYVNNSTKLRWQCKEGHVWEAIPNSVKKGTWCPTCSINKRKLTLYEMKSIAKSRDGKCLSDNYINAETKLLWECSEGHRWKSTPGVTKQGCWCPICAEQNKEIKFEEVEKIVKNKNGVITSKRDYELKKILMIKCENGHIFNLQKRKILWGSWCKECAIEKSRLKIEEMKEIAIKRGGECLSDEYVNNRTKLNWRCRYGHQWKAPSTYVKGNPEKNKKGTWCPVCAAQAPTNIFQWPTIGHMHLIAWERGGLCLSNRYVNNRFKLKWQCKEGHIWTARPSGIKRGGWCPECAHTKRLSIEEMQRIAEERGGKCLSKEYNNVMSKLKWQCKEGHIWDTTPAIIRKGCWCPICSMENRHVIINKYKHKKIDYNESISLPSPLVST